jgi:hypothetical protein
MSEEEFKSGQQPSKVRPKVSTMKACIVSMKYEIQLNDEIIKLDQLNESYADAEKLNNLFKNTLGWDKDDVITFKDSKLFISNIYETINNHIKDLKSAA